MRKACILSILLLSALLCTASCGFAAAPAGAPSKYSFTLDQGGIPGLGGDRSVIVVISDIHLGMDDRYAEIQKNRAPLADFLRKIGNAPNIRELVIAGDLIDEWFIPLVWTPTPEKPKSQITEPSPRTTKVFDAFNGIIGKERSRSPMFEVDCWSLPASDRLPRHAEARESGASGPTLRKAVLRSPSNTATGTTSSAPPTLFPTGR